MSTHRYPHKCMACGLHFNVYSWSENWLKEHSAFCPECGHRPAWALGSETHPEEIFQFVGAVIPAEVRAQLHRGEEETA